MPYFTVHLLCQQAMDGQVRQASKTSAAMAVNLLVTMKAGNCLAQPQQSLVGVTAKQVQQHTHTHTRWLQWVKAKCRTASHKPSLSVARGETRLLLKSCLLWSININQSQFWNIQPATSVRDISVLFDTTSSWQNNSSIQSWSKPILENHFPCSVKFLVDILALNPNYTYYATALSCNLNNHGVVFTGSSLTCSVSFVPCYAPTVNTLLLFHNQHDGTIRKCNWRLKRGRGSRMFSYGCSEAPQMFSQTLLNNMHCAFLDPTFG